MSDRFEAFLGFLQRALIVPLGRLLAAAGATVGTLGVHAWHRRMRFAMPAILAALAYALYIHPPLATVHRSEVLVRTNLFDGSAHAYSAGTVLLMPGIHQLRRYPTRDQLYRPSESARAAGPAPFQSSEGLSLGVDLTVRWAIDRSRIAQMSKEYPDDLNADLVRPAVQGIVYPLLARHAVREIFSSQRGQIQQEIASAAARLSSTYGPRPCMLTGTGAGCGGFGSSSPTKLLPRNWPGAGVGAMITCTLSDSLSASVFWMSSG